MTLYSVQFSGTGVVVAPTGGVLAARIAEQHDELLAYRLAGEGKIAGRDTYVLVATPRPGYRPKTLECRVLTGMRGKLWIDAQEHQWVMVEAEVFRPVSFAVFIAKVQPGTRFVLEQAPVEKGIWLPRRFQMRTQLTVLWWQRTESEDETYHNYRKPAVAASSVPAGGP